MGLRFGVLPRRAGARIDLLASWPAHAERPCRCTPPSDSPHPGYREVFGTDGFELLHFVATEDDEALDVRKALHQGFDESPAKASCAAADEDRPSNHLDSFLRCLTRRSGGYTVPMLFSASTAVRTRKFSWRAASSAKLPRSFTTCLSLIAAAWFRASVSAFREFRGLRRHRGTAPAHARKESLPRQAVLADTSHDPGLTLPEHHPGALKAQG